MFKKINKYLVSVVLLGSLVLTGCGQQAQSSVEEPSPTPEMENVLSETDFDSVLTLAKHGIGIIFFGNLEDEWDAKYGEILYEALNENEASAAYYKMDDSEESQQFEDLIRTVHYEGSATPFVLFVQEGEILGFDGEAALAKTDDADVDTYFTDEQIENLKNKLSGYTAQIVQAQNEHDDDHGCDTESACRID